MPSQAGGSDPFYVQAQALPTHALSTLSFNSSRYVTYRCPRGAWSISHLSDSELRSGVLVMCSVTRYIRTNGFRISREHSNNGPGLQALVERAEPVPKPMFDMSQLRYIVRQAYNVSVKTPSCLFYNYPPFTTWICNQQPYLSFPSSSLPSPRSQLPTLFRSSER